MYRVRRGWTDCKFEAAVSLRPTWTTQGDAISGQKKIIIITELTVEYKTRS